MFYIDGYSSKDSLDRYSSCPHHEAMTVTDTLSQAPTTIQTGLDFDAVLRTYEAVSRVLPETPAWSYPLLNAEAGVEVTVKHENV